MSRNLATRQLESFRQAYETLFRTVRQTMRMQLGDIGEIQGVKRQARILLEAGEANAVVFSTEEHDRFTRGIQMMVNVLDKLVALSRDQAEPSVRLISVHKSGKRGRPKHHINRTFLQAALKHRGPARISQVLKAVSARTVRRRALDYGLKLPGSSVYTQDPDTGYRTFHQPAARATEMTNEVLDEIIVDILEIFPTFGIRMVVGHLRAHGHIIPYKRVAAAMNRVRGVPGSFGPRRIHRRRYQVDGPNSLWHGDANLNLVFFGFVIQMFVDGFSRLVTTIQVSTNNKAKTVLEMFLRGVKERGVPSRVRGDHGTENLQVAAWMIRHRGDERGSYIFGKSVHNIRVERMWVDVTAGFGSKWKGFLQDLQANHGLDTSNSGHKWLLQFLFLSEIDQDAQEWARAWNAHTMRLPDQRAASPEEMYLFGLAERGERGIEERNAMLENPEDYGIDWAEFEHQNIVEHFISRNYPRSTSTSIFRPQPPTNFHHLQLEEPECPLSPTYVKEMCEHLAEACALGSQDMEERKRVWQVALQFCQSV